MNELGTYGIGDRPEPAAAVHSQQLSPDGTATGRGFHGNAASQALSWIKQGNPNNSSNRWETGLGIRRDARFVTPLFLVFE
jgi:hypothetical protein